MNELSYIDARGNTVFTSKFYRNRKTCCKSVCLHCPYGYTLRTIGVKIQEVSEDNEKEAKAFFYHVINSSSVSTSLLNSAFKNQTKKWDKENYKVLTLKEVFCGLAEFKEGKFIKHYLSSYFQDQGMDDSYIRSLL